MRSIGGYVACGQRSAVSDVRLSCHDPLRAGQVGKLFHEATFWDVEDADWSPTVRAAGGAAAAAARAEVAARPDARADTRTNTVW